MGSQLTVLSEPEAAALVATQPDAVSSSSSSVTNVVSPSSLFHTNSSPLSLQQPPFKLKGANRSLLLSTVNIHATYMCRVVNKT